MKCSDLLAIRGSLRYPVKGVPSLIVLGGWQNRSSYLKVDEAGASHRVVPDREPGGFAPRGDDASPVGRSPAPLGLRGDGIEDPGFKIQDSKVKNPEYFNQ